MLGKPFESEERGSTKVLRQELAWNTPRKLGTVCSWNRVSEGESDKRMESGKQLGDGMQVRWDLTDDFGFSLA